MSPADEGLRGSPPGPKLGRHSSPLGAVVMPPKDRLERAPEVLRRCLAFGPAGLNQRLQDSPLRVRQHACSPKCSRTSAAPIRSSHNRPYKDLINAACKAWQNLIAQPAAITSIGSREWALTGQK